MKVYAPAHLITRYGLQGQLVSSPIGIFFGNFTTGSTITRTPLTLLRKKVLDEKR